MKWSVQLIYICLIMMGTIMDTEAQKVLFDFSDNKDIADWQIINDGVMGGLSESKMLINKDENAVFSGSVSLENNGGFASVRYRFSLIVMNDYRCIVLRIKGDGKGYQLRVKENSYDRHAYISYFQSSGEWQVIEIPLEDMYPTFRGRRLDMPNYPGVRMEELAFLIANYRQESFRLEIDYIHLK
ncbi:MULTISPECIES: CIA30 family protein [unclassified Carboxylicivirga]|uniref:CIA30 family protein n=1 Tax=Carboxylicivirga TaxID=1628153 RepID=UPI003D33522A